MDLRTRASTDQTSTEFFSLRRMRCLRISSTTFYSISKSAWPGSYACWHVPGTMVVCFELCSIQGACIESVSKGAYRNVCFSQPVQSDLHTAAVLDTADREKDFGWACKCLVVFPEFSA